MPDFLDLIESLRAAKERRIAMATLVAARGGSPRPLGAKLLVGEGGRLLGSVSIGGCVDARVVEHAERVLQGNGSREKVTVVVDDDDALELGLACGAEFDLLIEPVRLDGANDNAIKPYLEARDIRQRGEAAWVITTMSSLRARTAVADRDVDGNPFARGVVQRGRAGAYETPGGEYFVEHVAPADTLVLVGASDVGAALARLVHTLGMRVVVIDGRERYATKERFATADAVLVGMPSELVRPHLTAGASLVLVAHEYKYELPILREALRSPVRFVGMLAGRKRAEGVRALLREDGLADAEIARLHAPIGLDIGGREPEEIALSIAAQLIAVREGKPIARR